LLWRLVFGDVVGTVEIEFEDGSGELFGVDELRLGRPH
jgi:hypothetical protein